MIGAIYRGVVSLYASALIWKLLIQGKNTYLRSHIFDRNFFSQMKLKGNGKINPLFLV